MNKISLLLTLFSLTASAALTPVISTTNVPEGVNLYYTQARFDSAFGAKSTSDLAEGTNLYWLQSRFNTAFSAKSTSNLAEGSNLYYTDARAIAAPLTGFAVSSGEPSATDTILQMFQKLVGNSGYLPSGVQLNGAGKALALPSSKGLQVSLKDSATQTNAAGGFNGSGVGNTQFISFSQLDGSNISALTSLSFNATELYNTADIPTSGWAVNILANFMNGPVAASDFVNLVWDGLPNSSYILFPITTSGNTFSLSTSDRAIHAVLGTGSVTQTGNTTSGSATITNLSNPNELTVGNYFKTTPTNNSLTPDSAGLFPDGTTIVSVNAGASTCVVSNTASATVTANSLVEYGGTAPVSRAGTANGTTTVTIGARGDGVTTTADLRAGMKVSCSGCGAGNFIQSLVANTSITLNNSVTTGAQTLTFVASGFSGIPVNSARVGIPWATIVANNPSAVFSNTTPINPTWTTTDGGWGKNIPFPSITAKLGASGTTQPSMYYFKQFSINGTNYNFGH